MSMYRHQCGHRYMYLRYMYTHVHVPVWSQIHVHVLEVHVHVPVWSQVLEVHTHTYMCVGYIKARTKRAKPDKLWVSFVYMYHSTQGGTTS